SRTVLLVYRVRRFFEEKSETPRGGILKGEINCEWDLWGERAKAKAKAKGKRTRHKLQTQPQPQPQPLPLAFARAGKRHAYVARCTSKAQYSSLYSVQYSAQQHLLVTACPKPCQHNTHKHRSLSLFRICNKHCSAWHQPLNGAVCVMVL